MVGLTTVVNWLAMASALWLGLFVVTRSPRSRSSWLAGLALGSVTLYFGGNVTYLHTSTAGDSALALTMLHLGGSLLPAAWFHLAVQLLPGRVHPRWTAAVATAYILAAISALATASTDLMLVAADQVDRTLAAGKAAGPLYPLFIGYGTTAALLSLILLHRLWRHDRRPALKIQLGYLRLATAIVVPAGLYLSIGIWQQWEVPTVPGDLVFAAGVVLLGYAVARWNALIEGRVLELDFIYTLLMVAAVAAIYLVGTGFLFGPASLPLVNVVIVVGLAILTHLTYDWARSFLDRFFYRRQFRQVRSNLRSFAREAGTGRGLEQHLGSIVQSLCDSFATSRGLIALAEGNAVGFLDGAVRRIESMEVGQGREPAREARILSSQERSKDRIDIAVEVPLLVRGEEIGVLALGDKVAGAVYTDADLELLEDIADQMAAVIATIQLQERSLQEIDDMVSDYRSRQRQVQRDVQALVTPDLPSEFPVPGGVERDEFVRMVEETLRRCHDVAFLGKHALCGLGIVSDALAADDETITHLERGRALRQVLIEAVERLKLEDEVPTHPPREWYPFIVLYDAYVVGETNREIMARLYISEGTFNRTRRRAVRAVARALAEMETALSATRSDALR